jgi:GDP-4-dehydro-6-deoxy-D-mannose reductase
MRALITGVTGFVGKHLAELLNVNNYIVFGTSRNISKEHNYLKYVEEVIETDLNSKEEIVRIIQNIRPDVVFHLAAQSNVKMSWENPSNTMCINVMKTIYLYEAVREVSKSIRIVSVGSSEEYGFSNGMTFPINEESSLNPSNPYGLSKMNVAILSKQYVSAYGLDIIHMRPFNHIGPGQKLGFIVPDFTHQIVRIEKGLQKPMLMVGNLSTKRDFTDVRDIVTGYMLACEKGVKGEVYNICSGKETAINDLLTFLIKSSTVPISISVDKDKLRPNDIPIYYGSNEKFVKQTSWNRQFTLEQTLRDVLSEIRNKEWMKST